MNQKKFQKFLDRDLRCWHCGVADETLVPHHRVNRGMGGSKLADRASNILVMCSAFNQAMEADYGAQMDAVAKGWKLAQGVDPSYAPVFDAYERKWWLLDDEFQRYRFLRRDDWE